MFTDIKSKYGITDSFLMSVQSIVEAENEEFDYIAYFHGLKYEFKAKSLWDAKQKATNHFSPPRKEAGLLAVELVNKKGPARIQFEDVEESDESINIEDLIAKLKQEWGGISKMDTGSAAKLGKILDKLSTKVLRQIARANINFVSGLALNRVSRRTHAIHEENEILEESRPVYQIAREIRKDWKNIYFGAKPYLDAMGGLDNINDNYYQDSGKSVVRYFLSNASSWRGDTAKRIKAELKNMLKEDVEELDEISKETLKNYLVKSKEQDPNLRRNLSIDTQERFDPNLPNDDKIAAEKRMKRTAKRIWNRQVGFHKAINRLTEEDTRESAKNAIIHRLKVKGEFIHLLNKFGLDKFISALDDVTEPLDDLEEIGSSDISIWTKQLKRTLGEDVEELDELSQKTLIDYVKKANDDEQKLAPKTSDGKKDTSANAQFRLPNNIWKKYKNRQKGIDKAEGKLPTGIAYHALTGN